jgi:hypothetical protein
MQETVCVYTEKDNTTAAAGYRLVLMGKYHRGVILRLFGSVGRISLRLAAPPPPPPHPPETHITISSFAIIKP